MRALLGFFLASLLLSIPAAAQRSETLNPSLHALVRGIDSGENERPLDIARLEVDVALRGTIAETTLLVQFTNPSREPVEGRFELDLPPESVVTGYALDIGGEMIDGVLVEQPKAREAYTDKVRRGIDPGLAEVARGNRFSTRVFPIFPRAGRTIRVRFVTPVDPVEGYVLPLASRGPVGEARIAVRAAARPRVDGPGLTLDWQAGGDSALARAEARNVRLEGALRVAPPAPEQPLLLSRHSTGGRFFTLDDAAPAAAARRERIERLRVYWDSSRSRLDDRTADELALLRRAVDELRPAAIDLVLFGSAAPKVLRLADGAGLAAAIEDIHYRGATSYAGLPGLDLPDADLCLLFTDGVATIDRREMPGTDCPLYPVTTAVDADTAWLRQVAAAAGGEAITLADDRAEALARIRARAPAISVVRDAHGNTVDFAVLPSAPGRLRIVGPMPDGETLSMLVRHADGRSEWKTYRLDGPAASHDGAGGLWAAARIAALVGDPARDEEVRALARRYSVATPDMAFIVLEAPHDYVQDEIEPPVSYPKHLRAEYVRMAAAHKEQQEAEKRRWRTELVRRWEAQKEWWETRFDPSRPLPREKAQALDLAEGPPPPAPPPPPPPPVTAPVPMVAAQEAIVTTGSRSPPSGAAAEAAGIALAPWDPDRPYLRALQAAGGDEIGRVYAAEERRYGGLPAFYLDVSEWLHRQGRRAEAVEVLLSALDLDVANNETIAIVAGRLLRWGETERAIFLFERLASAESFRPQPKRQLALAIAERARTRDGAAARADLERALRLLAEVIETPQSGDYVGIELISLMDANALLPRYRALGGRAEIIDRRLIALLDVDVRVLLEWSSGNNDIDLHVVEPTGEKVFYGNRLSRAGGRISNDMTSGYGPEEYLIRRAPGGGFEVLANIYRMDAINPNGTPVVSARLIRDWGRPSQREEVIDLELSPDDEGEKLIGTITVPR